MGQSVDSRSGNELTSGGARWFQRLPLLRIACLLIAIALFIVSLYSQSPYRTIVYLAVCAVSLLIATGPPLKWYKNNYINNRTGFMPKDNLDEKSELLASLMDGAMQSVQIVAGELNPKVFDHPKVISALAKAIEERGVEVQIISGDRTRSGDRMRSEEEFKDHLRNENKRMMTQLGEHLEDGRIRLFFGDRRHEHFYVFDDDGVVKEERHVPYVSRAWKWKKHTFYIGARYSNEFESVKERMKPVHFP